MRASVALMALALAGCGDFGAPATLQDALLSAERVGNRDGVHFHSGESADIVEKVVIEAPDTLVIRHSNFKTITRTFDPRAFENSIRGHICSYQVLRDVIEMGATVRVEITTHIGDELPALYFRRC